MKKKKEFSERIKELGLINTLAVVILMGVSIGLLIIFIFAKDKFNPDKDICDNWRCEFYAECQNCFCWGGCGFWTPTFMSDCELGQKGETRLVCEKWHKASKCELDANAEGCVCDEYRIQQNVFRVYLNITYINRDTLEPIFVIAELPPGTWYFEDDRILNNKGYYWFMSTTLNKSYKNITTDDCIKSHLPNECEKGNIDWVLEQKRCVLWNQNTTTSIGTMAICVEGKDIISNCQIVNTTIHNICLQWETVCRPKTIQDYSCAELKKAVLGFSYICRQKGYRLLNFLSRCFTSYEKSELYDIAITKGCDI